MAKTIKLFNNCIPIKGIERSIIYDLQRGGYQLIPNSLFELLESYDGQPIDSIKKAYNNQYDDIINEYIDFLIEKEYLFLTDEPNLFPKLNLNCESPSHVTNAILCLNKKNSYNLKQVLDQLEMLNCKALQFRIFKSISINEVAGILEFSIDSRFKSIEIILPYNERFLFHNIKEEFYKYHRLTKILLFNSPKNKTEFMDEQEAHLVVYSTNNIIDNSFCGNIHPNNFVQNIPFFTESQHYNTCLNRKVCIDENGNIKNCLSIDKHYGNINEVNLAEVIQLEEFQKLWHIKKDDIKVCKECEFRHMCMDCRAYIKDSNDIYSQPSKCHYNPYIDKWKGQEGYITIEEWQKQQQEKVE